MRPDSTLRPAFATIAMALSGLLCGACITADDGDPYSHVAPLCMERVPDLGKRFEFEDAAAHETYLTPACKAALESVIPYDEASFRAAPAGFKDKITEAFQALIAYPIETDQNSILGTNDPRIGAIPLDVLEIYRKGDNPNRAIFNYVFETLSTVRFGGRSPDAQASHSVRPTLTEEGTLTIYLGFWNPQANAHSPDLVRNPFVRASTIVHEARHGQGIFHSLCDLDKTGTASASCDPELAGSYGFETAYMHFLLQGSARCSSAQCQPALPPIVIEQLGREMCFLMRNYINNRYEALDQLVLGLDCGKVATYLWTIEREGLGMPKFDFGQEQL